MFVFFLWCCSLFIFKGRLKFQISLQPSVTPDGFHKNRLLLKLFVLICTISLRCTQLYYTGTRQERHLRQEGIKRYATHYISVPLNAKKHHSGRSCAHLEMGHIWFIHDDRYKIMWRKNVEETKGQLRRSVLLLWERETNDRETRIKLSLIHI